MKEMIASVDVFACGRINSPLSKMACDASISGAEQQLL